MIDEAQIEEIADEVRLTHELGQMPIDLQKIAKNEGIALLPGEYDGCFDGRLEFLQEDEKGKFYLYYKTVGVVPGRVRFSIAHELGHYYLPIHRDYLLSGRWHNSHSDFVSSKPMEAEADRFAACLLMPRQYFKRYVKKRSGFCTIKDLIKLSDVFQTSITSTAMRYVELCFEACCVVLSEKGTVLYSRRSDEMKVRGLGWIPSRSSIPSGSVTGAVVGPTAIGQIRDGSIGSQVWFDRERDERLWEETMPLGNTGLVLTLLACEPEEDEE